MLISGYLNRLKHLQDIEDETAFAFWTRNDISVRTKAYLFSKWLVLEGPGMR